MEGQEKREVQGRSEPSHSENKAFDSGSEGKQISGIYEPDEYTPEQDGIHTHEHHGTHTHPHNHSHTHDPKEMRKIVNRLSRSIGHLEAVKRMIEEGQDCADVLIQLAAVRSEINGAGKALLKEHLDHCIVEAVKEHDEESIARMDQAIDQFMK